MSTDVYIVSAKRTPIGSFMGSLSSLPATQLGAQSLKATLEDINIDKNLVDEVIMGQVLTAGAGQAPARQAAIYSGLTPSTPCLTINKVCGSGLKAVMLGADSIRLGYSQSVLAGGQENMSLAPHILPQSRTGYRMGPVTAQDTMVHDGLWDPYNNFHMGVAAEMCVKEYQFSREEQDQFAMESYEFAQKAQAAHLFDKEITPVEVKGRKETITVSLDDEPQKAKFDKIPKLRPAFDKEGTITAANASKINDGASSLFLASENFVKEHNLKPLAKIISQATFAQEPQWFTTAPIGAIKKSIESLSIEIENIDLFEINEAFSAVTMAAMKDLSLPREKVNPLGGAVALGHPIGASGARIFTTLVHALHSQDKQFGLASLCIGGGEAVSVVIERV